MKRGVVIAMTSGFNVAGVTDVDTGDYRVIFDRDMVDATYVAVGSAGPGPAGVAIVTFDAFATTHVGVRLWNTAGAAVDSANVSVVIFGVQ